MGVEAVVLGREMFVVSGLPAVPEVVVLREPSVRDAPDGVSGTTESVGFVVSAS